MGLKQDTLTAIYQESERLRQRKLQAARKEREKIIAEERGGGSVREGKKRDGWNDTRQDRDTNLNGSRNVTKMKGTIPTAALSDKVHYIKDKACSVSLYTPDAM